MHELTKKYKHLFIYSHYLDKREDDNQNKSRPTLFRETQIYC